MMVEANNKTYRAMVNGFEQNLLMELSSQSQTQILQND